MVRIPCLVRFVYGGITQSELCAGPATFSGRSPPLLPSVRPTIWANPRKSALPTQTKTYGPQRQKMALDRSPPPRGLARAPTGPQPCLPLPWTRPRSCECFASGSSGSRLKPPTSPSHPTGTPHTQGGGGGGGGGGGAGGKAAKDREWMRPDPPTPPDSDTDSRQLTTWAAVVTRGPPPASAAASVATMLSASCSADTGLPARTVRRNNPFERKRGLQQRTSHGSGGGRHRARRAAPQARGREPTFATRGVHPPSLPLVHVRPAHAPRAARGRDRRRAR